MKHGVHPQKKKAEVWEYKKLLWFCVCGMNGRQQADEEY